MHKELISLSQAAKLLGYHPNYVGELCRKGLLKASRLGSFWVTTRSDVQAYEKVYKRQKMACTDHS